MAWVVTLLIVCKVILWPWLTFKIMYFLDEEETHYFNRQSKGFVTNFEWGVDLFEINCFANKWRILSFFYFSSSLIYNGVSGYHHSFSIGFSPTKLDCLTTRRSGLIHCLGCNGYTRDLRSGIPCDLANFHLLIMTFLLHSGEVPNRRPSVQGHHQSRKD